MVFEEIENLNNNDYCLTTRIQTLEKMLAHQKVTTNKHTTEIDELKMAAPVSVPVATDGSVDTSAIFQKIKALEV